jgi:hypothetical protein
MKGKSEVDKQLPSTDGQLNGYHFEVELTISQTSFALVEKTHLSQ